MKAMGQVTACTTAHRRRSRLASPLHVVASRHAARLAWSTEEDPSRSQDLGGRLAGAGT
jgi:hypothetical protein